MAGQTYTDTNGGAYYKLGTGYDPGVPMFVLAQSQVLLSWAAPASVMSSSGVYTSKTVSGDVWVKNLAYQKVVRIAYTVDGWQTVQSAYATYTSTEYPGVERWSFKYAVPVSTTEVQLAVEYQVNGQSFWDNAFGSNYFVSF
ncbi:MAG: carbohydrate-binding protein [Anaeromyxobacter sp.]